MVWSLLAEGVMLAHLAFILFVAVGGVMALRFPQVAWLHAPAAVWSVLVTLTPWKCPLTTLEKHFVRRAGDGGYEGTFFQEYILPLLYIDALAEGMHYALAAGLIAINVLTYRQYVRSIFGGSLSRYPETSRTRSPSSQPSGVENGATPLLVKRPAG